MLANCCIQRDEGDFVYIAADRHQADYFVSTLQGMAGPAAGAFKRYGAGVMQSRYGRSGNHLVHSIGQGSLVNFYHCDYPVACVVADNAEGLEPHSQEIIAALGIRYKCKTLLLGTIIATNPCGQIIVPQRPAWSIHDGWDYVLLAKGVYQQCLSSTEPPAWSNAQTAAMPLPITFGLSSV